MYAGGGGLVLRVDGGGRGFLLLLFFFWVLGFSFFFGRGVLKGGLGGSSHTEQT